MNNIIDELKFYTVGDEGAVGNAGKEGLAIFKRAMEADLMHMPLEEVKQQYEKLAYAMDEKGYIRLLTDKHDNMPFDVFVDTCLKVNYVAVALGMTISKRDDDYFRNVIRANIFRMLLKASLSYGLRDHGYDCYLGELENLHLLSRGGLRTFLNDWPTGCDTFCEYLNEEMNFPFLKERNHRYYAVAFGEVEVTKKLEDIFTDYNAC